MAICYIVQEEIYNSSTQNDRLPYLQAESSTSLLEDLNYIRSVIFAVIGLDRNNPDNKWYKVPFYNLSFLYEKINELSSRLDSLSGSTGTGSGSGDSGSGSGDFSDFAVEHYTRAENPLLAGKHKNVTASGNLSVAGYGSIGVDFSVGRNASISRDLSVGRNTSISGMLTVSSSYIRFNNVYTINQ